MNGAPPLSLITLSLTCVASPSPARLEWVLSRSSLLVASPPISSRRLTTPTLAPSDPLARSCSFMQPALSSHRTRTLSLSLLSSLYMLTDTGTLSSSLPGWGISSTGPPLVKRHAPACRSTAHTAQRSTHALSRPTRLRLSVRHVSDRPRLRPSLLASARLCLPQHSTPALRMALCSRHCYRCYCCCCYGCCCYCCCCLSVPLSGVSGVGEG